MTGVLQVPCPLEEGGCGAKAGERCMTTDGFSMPSDFHPVRWATAKAEVLDELGAAAEQVGRPRPWWRFW